MNRHHEQRDKSLIDGLAPLDASLRAALRVEPPAGLAERVYGATVDRLVAGRSDDADPTVPPDMGALGQTLGDALHVEPPADLADRIYLATLGPLRKRRPAPGVLARIGLSLAAMRTAMAACLLIALGAGLWAASRDAGPALDQIDMVRLDRDAWQMRRAMVDLDEPLQQDVLELAVAVEQVAVRVDTDLAPDALYDSARSLSDELLLIESRLSTF